jgi:hypothetical protein
LKKNSSTRVSNIASILKYSFEVYILLMLLFLPIDKTFAQIYARWPVKTLTDGFSPDTNNIQTLTVKDIHNLQRYNVNEKTPRLPSEKQVVKLRGRIIVIQAETSVIGDKDYHIEISDGTLGDSTVVCESVDPVTLKLQSPYLRHFQKVRLEVLKLKAGDTITFTGVLHQDRKHALPNNRRTANFVEIHPILRVR